MTGLLRGSGPVRRIALASFVLLACTAVALALTVWSYHGAVHARQRAERAQHANDIAQRAQSNLWLERDAMNQYLLAPHPGILQEIFHFHDEFDAHIHNKRCPAGFCEALSADRVLVGVGG